MPGIMSKLSPLTSSNPLSTITHMGLNGGVSALGQHSMADSSGDAIGSLNDSLSQGIANQASMAAAQVKASTEQFAIGAQQQEANSTLHQAENSVATAVKFQNKLSDDAKEAI
jgi:hypothetical protein